MKICVGTIRQAGGLCVVGAYALDGESKGGYVHMAELCADKAYQQGARWQIVDY